VRLEDRIVCIALPEKKQDLEVPTPATACCGSIRIFEGGFLHTKSSSGVPPLFLSQSKSYGVATISRLLHIIGLFYKRAL